MMYIYTVNIFIFK